MVCFTSGEFRGCESKVSNKTGNTYFVFHFEELDSCNTFNMLSSKPNNFHDVVLKKGENCKIKFNLSVGSQFTKIEIIDIEALK